MCNEARAAPPLDPQTFNHLQPPPHRSFTRHRHACLSGTLFVLFSLPPTSLSPPSAWARINLQLLITQRWWVFQHRDHCWLQALWEKRFFNCSHLSGTQGHILNHNYELKGKEFNSLSPSIYLSIWQWSSHLCLFFCVIPLCVAVPSQFLWVISVRFMSQPCGLNESV